MATQYISVSVNLSKKNLDWLKEKTERELRKSVSNTLNYILTKKREECDGKKTKT